MAIPPRSLGEARTKADRSFVARRVVLPAQAYMHSATVSGFVLVAAAITALVWANSPWGETYFDFQHAKITLNLGFFAIEESVQHWVNDALMTLFFFVVGLEIKRELVSGELSSVRRASLPMIAALGGMVVPAGLYAALNLGGAIEGWGIPMATDIAFALAVLSLLGDRIPSQVRITLLALAIVDDIGAILVIALFYSEASFLPLLIAFGLFGVILLMRFVLGFINFTPYVIVGALMWLAVFESGVHATLAGVVLGFMAPSSPFYSRETFARSARSLIQKFEKAMSDDETTHADFMLGQMEELTLGTESPLDRLERKLHGWSNYLVLPIFALVNAGVRLDLPSLQAAMTNRITLGILCGLVLGKVIGIFGFTWAATRIGIAQLPEGTGMKQVTGIGLLAGIGFTVSLFITDLAFQEPADLSAAKIGILAASLLAGVLGYLYLRFLVTPASSSAVA